MISIKIALSHPRPVAPLATSFNRLLVLTPLLAHRDATNFRRKWIRKIGRQMYKLRNHRVNADDISIIPKVFWSRGVYFYGVWCGVFVGSIACLVLHRRPDSYSSSPALPLLPPSLSSPPPLSL